MTLAEKFEARGFERGRANAEVSIPATYFANVFEGDLAEWKTELEALPSGVRTELIECLWNFESANEVRQWIASKTSN